MTIATTMTTIPTVAMWCLILAVLIVAGIFLWAIFTRCTRELNVLRIRLMRCQHVLRRHHQWHQDIGEVYFPDDRTKQPSDMSVDLSDGYADSSLCEDTEDVLRSNLFEPMCESPSSIAEAFVAHLVEHCEGEEIDEAMLQQQLMEMLSSPVYAHRSALCRKQLAESTGVLEALSHWSSMPSDTRETICNVIDRNSKALANGIR